MARYFIEGNILFMSILTLLFLAILSMSAIIGLLTFQSSSQRINKTRILLPT